MKLRPADRFLTAALSLLTVGAAAGYIAVVAPTYDAENRIPPPPDRSVVSVMAAEPETEPSPSVDTLTANDPPQSAGTSLPEDPPAPPPPPETAPPETEPPEPLPPETEPPETEPPSPMTEPPPVDFAEPEPETEPEILTLELLPAEDEPGEISRGIPDLDELLDPAGYYIVNTDSGVVHEPGCWHLKSLKEQNRSGTDYPDELMENYSMYRWCKDCHK